MVRLDPACRQQQVNDGAFAYFADVPTQAFTLTAPQLTGIPQVFVMAPDPTKGRAVRDTLMQPVSTDRPATILRRHTAAALFLDTDSAALQSGELLLSGDV